MCGICGFMDPRGERHESELQAIVLEMAASLRHRGPDDSGAWVDARAGIALGHSRLAILDLSPGGHQPMVSADGRFVVSFNGELYNFKALRAELEALGQRFRGHCDTEVLVEGFARWGVRKTLEKSHGMLAVAAWDRDNRRLTLARDRMGQKPLYYGYIGHVLVFCSELKAARAFPAALPPVDPQAVALYLRYSCVPEPWCIFQGWRKVEPGSLVHLDPPQPGYGRVQRYWHLAEEVLAARESPFRGGYDQAVEALDQHLRRAVHDRMVADVPLGAMLSGGVDSTLVVALMQRLSGSGVKTFTIGNRDVMLDEAQDARAVAEHLGTEHHELYVDEADALQVVPRLPTLYDEPYGDSSQIPTLLVCDLCRQQVTVALSGDGGDELFGGYNRYFWLPSIWSKIERMPRGVRRVVARILVATPAWLWDILFRMLHRLIGLGVRIPLDKLYKLAELLECRDVREAYQSLVSFWQRPERLHKALPGDRWRSPLWEVELPLVEWMMLVDTGTYLPGDILTKVDRASMGVSLEARAPFMDHRLLRFAWSLPQEWKVADGQGKRILRSLLARYLPAELTERPKMGFGVPVARWLRGPLRNRWERWFARQELWDHLLQEPVRTALGQHLAGRRDSYRQLWNQFSLLAWLEAWL